MTRSPPRPSGTTGPTGTGKPSMCMRVTTSASTRVGSANCGSSSTRLKCEASMSVSTEVPSQRGHRTAEQSADRCRQVLFPKSVAVIGASPREDTLHGRVIRNLLDRGFRGDIYPVNPRYTEVAGLRCYPTPEAVGKRFDVGLLLVSAARTVEALEGCINAGASAAAIFSSGFGEAGPAGKEIEAAVVRRAQTLVIAGPNCNGILSHPAGAAMGFAPTLERTIEDAPR